MPVQSSLKVVCITGAAKRIGAAIARYLHQQGMNVIIHYRSSADDAKLLCDELNAIRQHTAAVIPADLNHIQYLPQFITNAQQIWGRLDALVNNASSFYPTRIGQVTEAQWDGLMNSNLKGHFFLAQAAAPYLADQQGCIVNITDTHASQPLRHYAVYCMAKAGLVMLTKALAKELAPMVRVNAVAPGAILWPEQENVLTTEQKKKIISQITLRRSGDPLDIAKAVGFFIEQANYVTGQVLQVDGGRDAQ